MDRPTLDRVAAARGLDAPAIAAALALTGAVPDAPAWRRFAARLLHAAGLAGVGAGVLFFVAANWQAWGLLGRFALLQAGLALCIGVALWRPAPQRAGRAALLLAILFAGALLALFGQSYQTGADLHELFFTWALLTLPFALAAHSGATWALWWTVLNAGLALLCGWLGAGHFFWRFIDGWGGDRATLLMLPCLANLLAAGAFLALRRTRSDEAAPGWLPRYLATLGVAYGTAAMVSVVSGHTADPGGEPGAGHGAGVVLLYTAVSAALALGTWRRKRDVFPLTLLAGSWIAISTVWLASALRLNDISELFLIAAWLIASSTMAGMGLMRWLRAWRPARTEGAAS